jgi:hypothetical protein
LDLSQFDEDFYINHIVSENDQGWQPLIRAMFNELRNNGWNRHIGVHLKEKYGKFEITLSTENEILNNIAEKYTDKINDTCMDCGEPGESASIAGWDYTLCFKHILEIYPIVNNIDEKGFDLRQERYTWEEISAIKLGKYQYTTYNHSAIGLFEAELFFIDERDTVTLSMEWINWFLFLKSIPAKLMPEKLIKPLHEFAEKLSYCPVCEFKAVDNGHCLRCYFTVSSVDIRKKNAEESGEIFDEKEFILKERDFLNDSFYLNKIMLLEHSFEKSRQSDFRI